MQVVNLKTEETQDEQLRNRLVGRVLSISTQLSSVLFAFILSSCGVIQSDVDKLQSKNDSLAQLLAQRDTIVSIKNSIVNQRKSKYTGQTYDIYISYPDNYKNSGKKYPVLLALDAEVNFAAINYITQRLAKDELAPELFVVGIAYQGDTDEDNYYSIRARHFTPTTDPAQEERHKNKFKFGTFFRWTF